MYFWFWFGGNGIYRTSKLDHRQQKNLEIQLKIHLSFINFLLDNCVPPYDPPSNLQVLQTVHPAVLRTFLQPVLRTVLRTPLRTVLRTVLLIQLCKKSV